MCMVCGRTGRGGGGAGEGRTAVNAVQSNVSTSDTTEKTSTQRVYRANDGSREKTAVKKIILGKKWCSLFTCVGHKV